MKLSMKVMPLLHLFKMKNYSDSKNLHQKTQDYRSYYSHAKAFSFADIIFISIIIVFAIIITTAFLPTNKGQYVEIYLSNNLIAKYPLKENREILFDIQGEFIIKIQDGNVSIVKSNCLNQICVKTPSISKSGQMIICAPKKITVLITSWTENGIYISG